MNNTDLKALLQSNLRKSNNRAILNDALLDLGYDTDLYTTWMLGYVDGFEAAMESGDNVEPDGGWDSLLINGIGAKCAAKVFGLKKSDIGSDAWMACCKVYHLGACEGAEEATTRKNCPEDSQSITIYRDGVWVGTGTIKKCGEIECSAVLGDTQSESDETYEAIMDAIDRQPQDEGRYTGSDYLVRPDGEYTWEISQG